jgi:hypothetical protein
MRPYWKGYLKLALVACPIALHAACSSAGVAFRHLVVAFNTADGWMRDVTADIPRELRFRGTDGRESSPEPTPMATLSYGGIFGDNSGGATPQSHRPSRRRSRR